MNLLDIADISGTSVSKYDGTKKYVATGDIVENKIINYEECLFENKPSRANVMIDLNDVLFAKMMNTKKVLLADNNNIKNIYSTGFCVLKPKNVVDKEYLYFLLVSDDFNEQKDKNCSGATQKAINNQSLSKIKIKDIPNIDTQKNRVKKLKSINNLISIKNSQIEKLDHLVKSQFVNHLKFGGVA